MKILLIEDELDISNYIRESLSSDIFTVDVAYTGNDGSYAARTNVYDAIILDYSLPLKNGISVLEEIRSAGVETPIIFLTIYNDIDKKIRALEGGADDYITKPFSYEELRARIQALARRPHKLEHVILTVDDLVLDTRKQTVQRGNSPIYLTRKEYNLMEFLMRNKGTVLSRGMIMEHVWNAESDPLSNTVEAHILNLRKKLGGTRGRDFVRNIPGRGYIIDA